MDHSNKLYSNLSRGFFNVTLINRKYLYDTFARRFTEFRVKRIRIIIIVILLTMENCNFLPQIIGG